MFAKRFHKFVHRKMVIYKCLLELESSEFLIDVQNTSKVIYNLQVRFDLSMKYHNRSFYEKINHFSNKCHLKLYYRKR